MTGVAKAEGFTLDHGAADLIAMLGDGSFRDALGMLERVISSATSDGSKKIGREMVESITGAPRAELVNDLVAAILNKEVDKALATINKASESGLNMVIFSNLILEKMRFIFLLQNSSASKTYIQVRVSPDDLAFIVGQAEKKSLAPNMLATMLQACAETGRASIESLPLELAVVKICV